MLYTAADPALNIIMAAGRTNADRVDALAAMLDGMLYADETADLVESIAEVFDVSSGGIIADIRARALDIEEEVAREPGAIIHVAWMAPAEWSSWGDGEVTRRLDEADAAWLERFAAWMSAAPAFAMAAE
jgi:hypothetical protein